MSSGMRWHARSFIALILVGFFSLLAHADVKIRSRMTVDGQNMESATYIKGKRQRNEWGSGQFRMVNLTQCDLRRNIRLNEAARRYVIEPFDDESTPVAAAAPAEARPAPTRPARRGGVVNYTMNVVDTGERRRMFGLLARHLKVTTTWESSPDACQQTKGRMERDGWYVDFQTDFHCEETLRPQLPTRRVQPDCKDRVIMRTTGTGKLGYPLIETTTIYGDDGRTTTMTQEVVELTTTPLDPALFEIPAGYTQARDEREMLAGMVASMSREDESGAASSPAASQPSVNVPNASADAASFTPASTPKRPGVVRFGLVLPRAQLPGDAARAAEGVRNSFASFLKGPNFEVVAIEARLPDQALAEAQQKNCDYVLFSDLTVKKGKSGGLFGRAMGSAIGSAAAAAVPHGNTTGDYVAHSIAVNAIYTAADVAGSIKAKDEVSLEYKLLKPDGTAVISNTLKAKADADGQDVISPLIERAAAATVGAARK